MIPARYVSTAPVPPPAFHRAQAKAGPALHLDALTLITRLRLLARCRLAVRLARRQSSSPPLAAGRGGRPRVYAEGSLLALALLRTLWRLSYQDVHDWLVAWPALALACGLPRDARGSVRVPSAAQQCKRAQQAGAPLYESLFVVLVHLARHTRLVGGREVIIDSAPILAWHRTDPDAAVGHAPHHHARSCKRQKSLAEDYTGFCRECPTFFSKTSRGTSLVLPRFGNRPKVLPRSRVLDNLATPLPSGRMSCGTRLRYEGRSAKPSDIPFPRWTCRSLGLHL